MNNTADVTDGKRIAVWSQSRTLLIHNYSNLREQIKEWQRTDFFCILISEAEYNLTAIGLWYGVFAIFYKECDFW
jgi:hypothetical protein